MHRLAAALQTDRTEIEPAIGGECGRRVSALSGSGKSIAWQRCVPRPRARQHVGEEDALVDLDAVLVALVQAGLGGDLLGRRGETGHRGRRRKHQILEAKHLAGRDLVVDRLGMDGEEAFAGLARTAEDQRRRCGFGGVPPRLGR